MKKIMIALGAVAFAAVAQSATMTWGSGTLKYAVNADGGWGTTTISTANTVTGYLISMTAEDYASWTVSFDAKSVYDAVTGGTLATTATAKNLATGTLSLKDTKTYASGDTAYAVILYTYHDAALDKDMYIGNYGTAVFSSSSNKNQGNMAINYQGTGSAIGGWQAVPEPTSGLMMLIGMGVLALRRRRA